MEAVKLFNQEVCNFKISRGHCRQIYNYLFYFIFLLKSKFSFQLSSLYEIKPPISKAKMTAITKGAIKAIKYYKHVVQSVEKFIQKCRPEYKIPGLYVIDSIARQSRHQFGPTKDVFAPRFAKNVQITFWHLYKCPEEEKVRSRKYNIHILVVISRNIFLSINYFVKLQYHGNFL